MQLKQLYPLSGDGGTGNVKSMKEGKVVFLVITMVAKAVVKRDNMATTDFFIIRIRISKSSILIVNISLVEFLKAYL